MTDTTNQTEQADGTEQGGDTTKQQPETPTDSQVGQRPPPAQRAPDDGFGPDRSLREWVELGAIAGLVVLAAVAGVGLYTSVTAAISRLVAPTYEPVFEAVVHLLGLLVAAIGLSVLLRRREAAST